MYKGMRSFKLIENNHCLLICKECKTTKVINLGKEYRLDEVYIQDKSVKITGGWIKFYGLCKRCMEKNIKVIDNHNQLAYNIVETDNYNQLLSASK
jgi:Fe2+ or Zn2+ uptake regulation protein